MTKSTKGLMFFGIMTMILIFAIYLIWPGEVRAGTFNYPVGVEEGNNYDTVIFNIRELHDSTLIYVDTHTTFPVDTFYALYDSLYYDFLTYVSFSGDGVGLVGPSSYLIVPTVIGTPEVGSYEKTIEIPNTMNYDTVWIEVKTDTTRRDSIIWTSFPVDTTITLNADSSYNILLYASFAGDGKDFYGAACQYIPSISIFSGSADMGPIYGEIIDGSGNYLSNARCWLIPYKSGNYVEVNGRMVKSARQHTKTTDLGYFSFNAIRTGQYDDTTKGFYNLQVYHGGRKLYDIRKIYVPDTGGVNVGELLMSRQ